MPIQLHNTLTREKQVFTPIDPNNVRMYVCGPTVYDYAHLGNGVPVIFFDVLFRLLRHTYGVDHVTYARNFTDVDDKIMARALETGEPISAITQKFETIYLEDMAALNTLPPTLMPRATEHMAQMIIMIDKLVASGHAYVNGGEVLFSVPSMPNYGRLSRNSRDDLIAGARVDVAAYKRDPADFTLWKPSTDEQPGWDSPWGRGRPGWHIECSAMSEAHLGETFDIHAGGGDLIFPHHENEIAQSECAHGGHVMANVWLHNGMLMVDGQKMSKSLGNFFTVHELLDEAPGEALRFAIMRGHYRSPIDFSRAALKQAKDDLDRLYRRIQNAPAGGKLDPRVVEALESDLNTPLAISVLHQLDDANLKASAELLGILQQEPEAWFKWQPKGATLSADEIEAQIEARKQARAAKNFAESDRIRDALLAQGIVLEDGAGGTTWRRG